jgi:uncharacterized coiled-coil protein SlyX
MWTSVSDRTSKENFQPVQAHEVLEKVAALPLTRWRYKAEPDGVEHLGPMAQDFYAAFGLGDSDTTIGSVDADGVALAAIQGLNELLNAKELELQKLKSKTNELEQRLAALETAISRSLSDRSRAEP